MQIAVTLSVAFKGCKATHCNATQSFWWIPDAMTCLLHILILLLFFLIHIELSEAPAFWSYFLNFLLKLYLFSLPPASEDQSLASTVELLSRCPITVLHNQFRNKGHLPPRPPVPHHDHDHVQAGLLGDHQSVCGYRSVECVLCRLTLPRNMLDCHRLGKPSS